MATPTRSLAVNFGPREASALGSHGNPWFLDASALAVPTGSHGTPGSGGLADAALRD
ncbi:hypothetical protein [Streptomyces sp. CA-106110]|uniref:hypothetical protein n=1 Tax=Streptomyces sp. CA-106110 TaxID=3240044 RepID=UPI003D8E3965